MFRLTAPEGRNIYSDTSNIYSNIFMAHANACKHIRMDFKRCHRYRTKLYNAKISKYCVPPCKIEIKIQTIMILPVSLIYKKAAS